MARFSLPLPLAVCRAVTDWHELEHCSVEPKMDGWRLQVHTGAGRLWSRHGTDLTAAFSDLAALTRQVPDCVLDGELLAVLPEGTISFAKLQTRAGRGPRRNEQFTVHLAAFDVLAVGTTDWRPRPRQERRAELLHLLADAPPALRPLPSTTSLDTARLWVGALEGVEGLVGKPDRPYSAGLASGWLKWRRRHTSDAIVLGVSGRTAATQALVLGLPYRNDFRAVGVSLPLTRALAGDLISRLRPSGLTEQRLPGTVGGLPGAAPVAYLPVIPDVVVEIEADQERPTEFGRFRHRPRVLRVRGDLRPQDLPQA
ncbi:ATP-dependent DNA ligase [Streptomyces venezuelae]|uniref:ATP-dependent DNA ligase n=1 Tax=Streptomyces venezuelae TaxID=54571 RepID=UPI0034435719